MSFKAVFKALALAMQGSVADDKKAGFDDVIKNIDSLEEPAPPANPPANPPAPENPPLKTDGVPPAVLEHIQRQNALIEANNRKIEAMEKAEADRAKALEEQSRKALTQKVDAKIAEMKKDGRLAPKDEAGEKAWRAQLSTGYDTAVVIADSLPKAPAPSHQHQQTTSTTGENVVVAKTGLGKSANPSILKNVLANLPTD